MINSSKVLLRVGKLRGNFSWRTPNLVQTIVSQTSSYIVCFNFLCWAVKSFILRGSLPQKDPKILSEQLSHKHLPTLWVSTLYVEQFKRKNFLLCKFQLSMLSISKVLFLEWLFWMGSPPRRIPKFGQNIIVSPTTSYIVSYNCLRQAVQNDPFWGEAL